jgi:hypothetical protein
MSKQNNPESRVQNKEPQNFRLTLETIRKLEMAARGYGMSKTVYVEMALKAQFKKDGIQ